MSGRPVAVGRQTDGSPDLPGAAARERPFGVHVRMARWKSLVVLVTIPLTLLITQILLFQLVALIEGPASPGGAAALSPLLIVAVAVSTAVTAAVATVLVAATAKVPWREVFRHRRRFDWRRLGTYLLAAAALVGVGLVAFALIAPEVTGWGALAVNAMSVSLVVVALLATPVQSAGEEVAFRGAVVPAAGSWFTHTRLALAFGMLVSGALFALVHASLEPWFVTYMFVLSACTALMGAVSGGLEAAIAFHVSNNVLLGIVNALFAGDGATVIERGSDAGPGPTYLILMVVNVAVLGVVWRVERRKHTNAAAR